MSFIAPQYPLKCNDDEALYIHNAQSERLLSGEQVSTLNSHPTLSHLLLILPKSIIINRYNIMHLMQPYLHLMDSLDRPLDLYNVDESSWSDKC